MKRLAQAVTKRSRRPPPPPPPPKPKPHYNNVKTAAESVARDHTADRESKTSIYRPSSVGEGIPKARSRKITLVPSSKAMTGRLQSLLTKAQQQPATTITPLATSKVAAPKPFAVDLTAGSDPGRDVTALLGVYIQVGEYAGRPLLQQQRAGSGNDQDSTIGRQHPPPLLPLPLLPALQNELNKNSRQTQQHHRVKGTKSCHWMYYSVKQQRWVVSSVDVIKLCANHSTSADAGPKTADSSLRTSALLSPRDRANLTLPHHVEEWIALKRKNRQWVYVALYLECWCALYDDRSQFLCHSAHGVFRLCPEVRCVSIQVPGRHSADSFRQTVR
mgnify:CR=1 FL=1